MRLLGLQTQTILIATVAAIIGISSGILSALPFATTFMWSSLLLVGVAFILVYFKSKSVIYLHGIAIVFSVILICLPLTEFSLFRLPIAGLDGIPTYFTLGIPLLMLTFILQVFVRSYNFESNKLIWSQSALLLLFLAICITGLIVNSRSMDDYNKLIRLVIFILNYVVLLFVINRRSFLQLTLLTYLGCAVFLIGLGIYYYNYAPLGSARLTLSEGRSSNVVAFALNPAILVMIVFGIFDTSTSAIKRLFFLSLISVMLYGLFLTLSRGAWLSLGVGILIFSFLSLRKWHLVLFIMLLLIGVFFTVFPDSLDVVWQSVSSQRELQLRLTLFQDPFQDQSLNSRLDIWEGYWDAISQNPFWGAIREVSDIYIPHNSFLYIWYEYGIFALLTLLTFFAQHGIRLLRYRQQCSDQEYLWCNLFFAMFVMLLIHSLVAEFIIGYFFWFILALQSASINVWVTPVKQNLLVTKAKSGKMVAVKSMSRAPIAIR